MYYMYRGKKKERKGIKRLLFLLILILILFYSFKYRSYLQFWKYSSNKLQTKINESYNIKSKEERRNKLYELLDYVDNFKKGDLISVENNFFQGKIHYLIGCTYLPGKFSELLINDKIKDINQKAQNEFISSIKKIKKGRALLDGKLSNIENSLILAKSCFYTNYSSNEELYEIIVNEVDPKKIDNIEDIRFYSIINILNNKNNLAFQILSEKNSGTESIEELLFLATLQKIAKLYTDSIINYKLVLNKTTDLKILQLVHVNLGKIYFNQSLYGESLEQFLYALNNNKNDNSLKIWIGKNYLALGLKEKAKKILNEVLVTDTTNFEAKNILITL